MNLNASPSESGSSGNSSDNGESNCRERGNPCGACKVLRRKCMSGCIFAPYFNSEQGMSNFVAVHKIFGASNASKMLHNVPMHKRHDAVATLCYEAQSRLRDPVYGCVSYINALHQQVVKLQAENAYLQGRLATVMLPHPPLPLPQVMMAPLHLFPTISSPTTSTSTVRGSNVRIFEPQTTISKVQRMEGSSNSRNAGHPKRLLSAEKLGLSKVKTRN